MKWLSKNPDLLFVAAILTILMVVFVPMPPAVMDGFLVASLSISVIALLTVVYIREPLDFSVFPTILLLSTALRLGLNIATTRMILTRAAEDGTGAAGKVIEAFGLFVAGNEPVVGGVIFALITLVNFMVITRGGNRVSEVAARFTLDALPGKQMAIDSEVHGGSIDDAEAQRRRQRVWSEATFYGSMDGAMKFVRGDAVAGIVITCVNIVGGLIMGAGKYGMSFGDALSTFTILTVGDGLVSQVPALMVSIAAGLMVTRSSSTENLGKQFAGQLFAERRVLAIAGSFTLVLALFSATQFSLLTVELMTAGGILFALYAWLGRKNRADAASPAPKREVQNDLEKILRVEALEIELGFKHVRWAPVLMERVGALRRELAERLGFLLPSLKIRDNLKLRSDGYEIKLRGAKIAEGAGDADSIVPRLRHAVESNAAELLSREDARRLIGAMRETHPGLAERAVEKINVLHKVLQNLLSEAVSIRDLPSIVECVAEGPAIPDILTARARLALARSICQSCVAPDGKLYAVRLDAPVEEMIRKSHETGIALHLNTEMFGRLTEAISRELKRCSVAGAVPVIVTESPIRQAVRRVTETINASIPVLAREEIVRGTPTEWLGVVRTEEPVAA